MILDQFIVFLQKKTTKAPVFVCRFFKPSWLYLFLSVFFNYRPDFSPVLNTGYIFKSSIVNKKIIFLPIFRRDSV